ncbi:hypothetical protein PAE975_6046 (plasmid) [Pseudomonas aeruginosa]|uniref:hypothetical protein n=1 Tax=Pseudomonas aeruginosa TaxID=287 RepID=UPI003753D366
MARSLFPKLADGEYIAKCKEKSAISAAVNGHSQVWPEAKVVVKDGNARFYKDGSLVWECNATYARGNFEVTPAPAKGK